MALMSTIRDLDPVPTADDFSSKGDINPDPARRNSDLADLEGERDIP